MTGELSCNALFKETVSVSMIETKDFKTAGLASAFIGAIADLLCGEENTATVTNLFEMYVDKTMSIYRRNDLVG